VRGGVPVDAWPFSPDGDPAWVSLAPSEAALAFIFATAASLPPSMCARVVGGVVPETKSRPSRSSVVVYVRPALTPAAVALRRGVGLVGDHGGIQWQFVEDDQRQQRLDRAGWCVSGVLVAPSEDLPVVHVGDDPGRRGTSGISAVPAGWTSTSAPRKAR